MNKLEQELKSAMRVLRYRLSTETDENSIIFSIIVSGRVDGEMLIEYRLEQQYGSDFDVKGGTYEATVTEFIRRAGWQRKHKPLALPHPAESHPPAALPDDFIL